MVQQQQGRRWRNSLSNLDSGWMSAEKRAQEAASSLKKAIQLVHEDNAPRRFLTSLPKRKVLLDNLLRVSSCIQQFLDQFSILRKEVNSAHAKLQATAGAHTDVLHEMEALSSGMAAFKALNEDHVLSIPSRTSLSDTSHVSEEEARVQITKLKRENEVLTNEIEAKAAALDLAERSKSCALGQVEKHKEVIAKTTADNMIFVMKLKQMEEQLEIIKAQLKESEEKHKVAKAKQDDTQSQLDIYRSSWYQEASVEIEDAVKDSLDKVSACEFELQTVRKQQELRVQEWELKLETLTQKLKEACLMRASAEERLKGLEEERSRLSDEIFKQAIQRQQMETEARTFASTVEKKNREMADLKEQYAKLLEDTKEKSEELYARAEKENQLIASLSSISSQLETQRAINLALMKKKEEVEWDYLEAQAERERLKQQLRTC